jgi:hypothetical protein
MDINNDIILKFSFFSETIKELFEGEFTFRPFLTIKKQLEMERKVNSIENHTFADRILIFLQQSIIESPIWWKESNKGEDLLDWGIIDLLYKQVIEQIEVANTKRLGK